MKAAQDLARKRWQDTTAEERSEHAMMMADARQEAMTPEERKASARNAAQARWAKKKGAKKAAKKK